MDFRIQTHTMEIPFSIYFGIGISVLFQYFLFMWYEHPKNKPKYLAAAAAVAAHRLCCSNKFLLECKYKRCVEFILENVHSNAPIQGNDVDAFGWQQQRQQQQYAQVLGQQQLL